MDFGNCWVKPLHFLNAGIKKRFGDKFTASFSVRNLIERPQHIGARGDGFVRMVDVKQQWNDRSFTIGGPTTSSRAKPSNARRSKRVRPTRKKPPVKFPGQHHGTRDTRPGSHDPKHNIPERTQHRGTQHPQTCTAGHSIAGYNPDRVTGNTATRKQHLKRPPPDQSAGRGVCPVAKGRQGKADGNCRMQLKKKKVFSRLNNCKINYLFIYSI